LFAKQSDSQRRNEQRNLYALLVRKDDRVTNDEIKSELIKLAAECFRADLMPPLFVTDWDLPKSTPKRARDEIQGHMAQVRLTASGWGRRLKALADKLPKSDAELGLKPYGESIANYQAENRRQ
jgi:hypothetical protein